MQCRVSAPFADTRATDLRWSLTHPMVPALATVVCEDADRAIRLNVLGASHQVLVERGGHRLVETVAYLPGAHDALPRPGARRGLDHAPVGTTYDIRATVEHLTLDDLGCRVTTIRRDLDKDPRAVVADFPGEPHAITALQTLPPETGRIGWTTWHVYPQHGEIVRTQTRITVDDAQEQR